jgi:Na+/melibiose symporter-like transporter
METLILGWYVLVETRSVLMLTVFASLQHMGTLIAPMFGVIGDRIGQRTLLCGMRAVYATLASTTMILAFSGVLTPTYVLMIAGVMGLVRPSDVGVRVALVGDTMPSHFLTSAISIQRTTMDSARIIGALTGATLVAMLGIGHAYLCVAGLYITSAMLTSQAGRSRENAVPIATTTKASPWRDLREGLGYVWKTPQLFAIMCLAFSLNLTAFPLMNGLMPYVAKEVYQLDQTWLGYMVASGATGALIGSLVMSRYGSRVRPARVAIIFSVVWLAVLMIFAQLRIPLGGCAMLVFAGWAQSMGQIPMATMILRATDEQFRGRVMGIRMLAIYGNLPGLLLSGPLISALGYSSTAALYAAFGITVAVLVSYRWREHLWRTAAPANAR